MKKEAIEKNNTAEHFAKEPNKGSNWIWIFFIFFAVLLIYSIFWLIIYKSFCSYETRGQFGDMFGATNALFSGLAFAGIVITLILQQQELKNQQKEIERQNTAIKRQRFESTFFSMMGIHCEQLSALQSDKTATKGRKLLNTIVFDYRSLLQNQGSEIYNELDFSKYQSAYQPYINSYLPDISHYLQSLFALYYSIITYTIDLNVRKRYFIMLKSYISLPEKVFLFYHTILSDEIGINNTLRVMVKDLEVLNEIGGTYLLNNSHISLKETYEQIWNSKLEKMSNELNQFEI